MARRSLTELATAQEGRIVSIDAGWGLRQRLDRLGLREGQLVRKLSGLALGGPVVVLVARAQVAIGRGVARRVVVETGQAPGGRGGGAE